MTITLNIKIDENNSNRMKPIISKTTLLILLLFLTLSSHLFNYYPFGPTTDVRITASNYGYSILYLIISASRTLVRTLT